MNLIQKVKTPMTLMRIVTNMRIMLRTLVLGGDVPDITVADIEAELGNQLQAMAMQGGIGQVRLVSVHTMDGDQRDSLVDNPHNIELIDDNDNMTEDNA